MKKHEVTLPVADGQYCRILSEDEILLIKHLAWEEGFEAAATYADFNGVHVDNPYDDPRKSEDDS